VCLNACVTFFFFDYFLMRYDIRNHRNCTSSFIHIIHTYIHTSQFFSATASNKPMLGKDLAWIKLTAPIPPEQRTTTISRANIVEITPRATCFDLDQNDYVAVGHEDGYTQIWDLRTVQSMVRLLDPYTASKKNAGRVVKVELTKDLRVIVLHPGHVFLWDLRRRVAEGPTKILTLKDLNVIQITSVKNDLFLLLDSEKATTTTESIKKKRKLSSSTTTNLCVVKGFLLQSSNKDSIPATIERLDLFENTTTTTKYKPIVSVISMEEKDSILVVRSDCELAMISTTTQKTEHISSSHVASTKQRAIGARLDDESNLLTIWCSSGVIIVFDLTSCFRVAELSDPVSRKRFVEAHARENLVIGLVSEHNHDESGILYWNRDLSCAIIHRMTEPGKTGLNQIRFFRRREYKRNVLLALTRANERARRGKTTSANGKAVLEGEASVFLLVKRFERTWHGPFFSPDFEVLTTNEMYKERENEFDHDAVLKYSCSTKEGEKKKTIENDDDVLIDHFTIPRTNENSFVPVEIVQQEFTAKQKGYEDWNGKSMKLW